MDYFFDRNTSTVCVKTDAGYYSQKDKIQDFLMPETLQADGVNYSAAGMISLSEYISYTTEKDVLYCIYFLLKAISEWNEKADSRLRLILNTETVFYDKRKNRFCFAAGCADGEDVNPIAFISDLIFKAVFRDKDLQTAVELINFIRASIHTSARDVLLFIEMSKYGRGYMSDWTKFKKSFDSAKTSDSSLASAKNKNKSFNSVNNSTDFSDFLSTEDLFSDAQPDIPKNDGYGSNSIFEEEKAAEIYATQEDISDDYLSVNSFVTEEETEIFVHEERAEGETQEMLHSASVQQAYYAEEDNDEPYNDEPYTAQQYVDEPFIESDAEVPYIEPPRYEAPQAEVPYVEPPRYEAPQAEVPYVEPPRYEAPQAEVPYVEPPRYEAPQAEVPYVEPPRHEVPQAGIPYVEPPRFEVTEDDLTYVASRQVETQYTEVMPYAEPVRTAYLVDENGNQTYINKDYFVIGRNSKESDMSIRDSSMSRRHAAFIKEGNDFYIEDLGSLNKTFLNGKQVLPSNRALLADGDCVMVSRNKFLIYIIQSDERL